MVSLWSAIRRHIEEKQAPVSGETFAHRIGGDASFIDKGLPSGNISDLLEEAKRPGLHLTFSTLCGTFRSQELSCGSKVVSFGGYDVSPTSRCLVWHDVTDWLLENGFSIFYPRSGGPAALAPPPDATVWYERESISVGVAPFVADSGCVTNLGASFEQVRPDPKYRR